MANLEVEAAVQAAWKKKLQAMAGLPAVAWPNDPFEPPVGAIFIVPALLLAPARQASVGPTGLDQRDAIYEINIYAPRGSAEADTIALVDDLKKHFERGTWIVEEPARFQILNAGPLPAVPDPELYHVPFQIRAIGWTPKA